MKRAVIQTSLILILSVAFFANTFADSCEGVCNRPPVAENTFFVQINQFESTTGTLPASDPDSDPLIFTIVKPPVGGTISEISSDGDLLIQQLEIFLEQIIYYSR